MMPCADFGCLVYKNVQEGRWNKSLGQPSYATQGVLSFWSSKRTLKCLISNYSC